ncbi:MAG: outer membrane lipoprotein carrier protein LolA [Bacteroidales bacterium]|nr:outer membrane lipoprotein carrier protein LolA [Bacteroidales bacterium]
MKKTNLIIGILICFLIGNAQEPSKKIKDDESVAVLAVVQKKLKTIQTAEIKFSLRTEKDNKTMDIIKGNLWLKGDKYKLQVPAQHIYCDSVNVWSYLPNQNEVSISPYDPSDEENAINPIKLINNYKKYYRSVFVRETTEKGLITQIIDLYPLQKSSFFKVRLVIDKNKSEILRISISEYNGYTYTYGFDTFIKNPKLNNSLFIFNPNQYKDIEVIDMR